MESQPNRGRFPKENFLQRGKERWLGNNGNQHTGAPFFHNGGIKTHILGTSLVQLLRQIGVHLRVQIINVGFNLKGNLLNALHIQLALPDAQIIGDIVKRFATSPIPNRLNAEGKAFGDSPLRKIRYQRGTGGGYQLAGNIHPMHGKITNEV